MKFVLRKATKSGSNNPIKPRPKTGYIPFELRGVDISTGGPAKLIDALKQTSISKKLFHEPVHIIHIY